MMKLLLLLLLNCQLLCNENLSGYLVPFKSLPQSHGSNIVPVNNPKNNFHSNNNGDDNEVEEKVAFHRVGNNETAKGDQ